ncbi:MAG: methyltransferase domain-containing protein [Clostridia bacterium]|nr:methyltransferase domain-containing protein [Clostridia bacterium]
MSYFICPVCSGKLDVRDNTYSCLNRHCFDVSKEGYVNLLMSQQSSSKRHGDDKLMVRARRDFLEKGFYSPLQKLLCKAVSKNVACGGVIADIGCGEGYYTKAVSLTNNYNVFGVDISKEALKYAAKLVKNASFAVASAFSLPFEDESCDCVLSVFAPSAYEEFYRILKSDGVLIKVVPLEDHLWDLKSTVYDEPYKNKPEIRNDDLFRLVSVEELKYNITLDCNNDIMNLFKMTPYYYKTGREEIQKLSFMTDLETIVHFAVEVYEKR